MDSWLVALISGGLTLAAALLTTYLNGRSAARNLALQLDAEERRHRSQLSFDERKHQDEREAAHRALVFGNQTQAAMDFLASFAAYGYSAAATLGAVFANQSLKSRGSQIDREALEGRFGHNAALRKLLDAEAAVTLYLPDEIHAMAGAAVKLEVDWTAAMRRHYEKGDPDPGPHPSQVDEAMREFRSAVKRLLGLDRS